LVAASSFLILVKISGGTVLVVLTTVGAAAPFSSVSSFVYCEPKNSFGGTLLVEPLSLELDLPDDEFTCLGGKSSESLALESTFGTVLVDSLNYYYIIIKFKS